MTQDVEEQETKTEIGISIMMGIIVLKKKSTIINISTFLSGLLGH